MARTERAADKDDRISGRVVTFGEIMLRLSPTGNRRFRQADTWEATYGGSEANVAVSLSQFGLEAEFVTRVPATELADAALDFLRQFEVNLNHVVRGGDRLGIYFHELGAAQRGSKVVYDRAHSGMSSIDVTSVDWSAVMMGARWFHTTGITAALSSSAAAVALEAARTARSAGATVSVDLNYRAKLWESRAHAESVMQDLVAEADVVFGNEDDLQNVFRIGEAVRRGGRELLDPRNYASKCQELHRRFPNVRVVALTMRGSVSASHNTWSGVASTGGQFHVGQTYDIEPIVDRVGAGDAFVAGMIYGLIVLGDDLPAALRFGVAASCLKHSVMGDVNLATLSEVNALLTGDTAGRIAR